MKINPLHATDFYKTGHIKQYPPNTTEVYSNFTCRGSAHATLLDKKDDRVVFLWLTGNVYMAFTGLLE
jgi:nicotinamide phosphoribosyltransferase